MGRPILAALLFFACLAQAFEDPAVAVRASQYQQLIQDIRGKDAIAPVASARDRQLCVAGVGHGQSYEVTLRAGLPSAAGERLAQAATFTVQVPERTPSVGFRGATYILPRVGSQGLPLTLKLVRPDEVEAARLPLAGNARTGAWSVRAFADPDAESVGQLSFQVEDFVPQRLRLEFTSAAQMLTPSVSAEVDVTGQFLYGAPSGSSGWG